MPELIEDSFAVDGVPRLEVANEVGDVLVSSGPDGVVSIQATIEQPDTVDYEVQRDGGTISVEAKRKDRGDLGHRGRADISVEVPHRLVVEIATVVGDVRLSDVEGSGTLATINGKLVVDSVKGDFECSVVNGSLVMDAVTGSFNASTVNGRISFAGEMAPGSKNGFETVNGEVRVKLRAGTRVNVSATTVNGGFSNNPPDIPGGVHTAEPAELSVSTVNGSVTVE